MIISWYDVTTVEPGGDTIAICLMCAPSLRYFWRALGVDEDMVCTPKSIEVQEWDEELHCEACGALIAKATMPE